MDKTIKLLVIKAEDNKRLDLYLQNKMKKYSRSLLKKITRYNPKTNYKTGIKKFLKWYLDYYK